MVVLSLSNYSTIQNLIAYHRATECTEMHNLSYMFFFRYLRVWPQARLLVGPQSAARVRFLSFPCLFPHGLDHGPRLGRGAGPDRVAQGNLIAAHGA